MIEDVISISQQQPSGTLYYLALVDIPFRMPELPSELVEFRRICKVPWKGYLKNLEYPVHEKVKFSTFAPS